MSLYGGIYLFYGDLCPKLWTPQPNWLDIVVYGDLCPKLWTPQPNWFDMGLIYLCTGICVQRCGRPSLTGVLCLCTGVFIYLFYGDLCPKLWTPKPNWLNLFVYGDYVQSCGHPSLTGLV